MDDLKFLHERIDRLRIELKEDFKEVIAAEVTERKALEDRVDALEKVVNRTVGGALVVSGFVSLIIKKLGG